MFSSPFFQQARKQSRSRSEIDDSLVFFTQKPLNPQDDVVIVVFRLLQGQQIVFSQVSHFKLQYPIIFPCSSNTAMHFSGIR